MNLKSKTKEKDMSDANVCLDKVSTRTGKKGKDTLSKSLDQVDHNEPTQIGISDKSLSNLDNKFYCEKCDYYGRDTFNYNRHLESPRHKKKINGESTIKIYKCEYEGCNYSTKYKGDMEKHIERKHKEKDMSKKTRDDIFKEICKYNGKIKKLKEIIKYGKENGKEIDKEMEETKLQGYVEQYNYLCRLFNNKDIDKKVLVKGEKQKTPIKRLKKENTNEKDKIIKEIKKILDEIISLGLDPNDEFCLPKVYEDETMDELEILKYRIEDIWFDKNYMNEWIELNKA